MSVSIAAKRLCSGYHAIGILMPLCHKFAVALSGGQLAKLSRRWSPRCL